MSKMRLRSLLLISSLLILILVVSGCGGKVVTETIQESPAVAEDEADQPSYVEASEKPAPTGEDEEPAEEPDDSKPATKTPTVTASPVPATKEPTVDSGGSGDSDAPTPVSPTVTSSPPPASPTPSDSGSGGGGFSGGGGSGSPTQTGPYSDAPLPGDTSGEQTELSDFENAAQNAGTATYSGLRCGVGTETGTCLCTYNTTVTAVFTFTDPNNMLWVVTPAGGSTQTIGMHRQGINTWVSDPVFPGGDVTSVQYRIIFAEWGYQLQSTVTYTSGISGTCFLNWIRL